MIADFVMYLYFHSYSSYVTMNMFLVFRLHTVIRSRIRQKTAHWRWPERMGQRPLQETRNGADGTCPRRSPLPSNRKPLLPGMLRLQHPAMRSGENYRHQAERQVQRPLDRWPLPVPACGMLPLVMPPLEPWHRAEKHLELLPLPARAHARIDGMKHHALKEVRSGTPTFFYRVPVFITSMF